VEDPDLVEWIAKQTDWYGQRQVCSLKYLLKNDNPYINQRDSVIQLQIPDSFSPYCGAGAA
jgi:hypothetical protein